MAHLRSTAVAALVAVVVAGCGGAPESGALEEASSEDEALVRIAPPNNTIHLSGANTPGVWQVLDGALFNTFAVRRTGAGRAKLIGVNQSSSTMQTCGHLVCNGSTKIPINVTLQTSKGAQAQFAEVTVATLPATGCGIFVVDLTVGPPSEMAFICGFL
jgi:hypothetical protein